LRAESAHSSSSHRTSKKHGDAIAAEEMAESGSAIFSLLIRGDYQSLVSKSISNNFSYLKATEQSSLKPFLPHLFLVAKKYNLVHLLLPFRECNTLRELLEIPLDFHHDTSSMVPAYYVPSDQFVEY
jgi:hypothetical protein